MYADLKSMKKLFCFAFSFLDFPRVKAVLFRLYILALFSEYFYEPFKEQQSLFLFSFSKNKHQKAVKFILF